MPVIRKHSLHGLGHIFNPFKDISDDKWHESIWYDILKYHYEMISIDELNDKYSNVYAISRMTISTPHLMDRFKVLNSDPHFSNPKISAPHLKFTVLNKNKPYERQIKPFNFMLVGVSNFEGKDGFMVKPLVPFTKDHQHIVYGNFTDYRSGKTMTGIEYWKPMDRVFWDYLNHPESKFDGNTGKLERKHLHVCSIMHIGKESDNLDVAQVIGVQDGDCTLYARTQTSTNVHMQTCVKHAETSSKCTNADTESTNVQTCKDPVHAYILQMTPQDAYRCGISAKTLKRWKRGIRMGMPVMIRKGMMKKLMRRLRYI
jgi:hypothetical protein